MSLHPDTRARKEGATHVKRFPDGTATYMRPATARRIGWEAYYTAWGDRSGWYEPANTPAEFNATPLHPRPFLVRLKRPRHVGDTWVVYVHAWDWTRSRPTVSSNPPREVLRGYVRELSTPLPQRQEPDIIPIPPEEDVALQNWRRWFERPTLHQLPRPTAREAQRARIARFYREDT